VRDLDFALCENVSKRLNTAIANFIVTEVDSGQCLCEKMKMCTADIRTETKIHLAV
jgi:hypothetical protein